MRKKLDQPSTLSVVVTRGFRQAAEEAVVRARMAGVEPAGMQAKPSAKLRAEPGGKKGRHRDSKVARTLRATEEA